MINKESIEKPKKYLKLIYSDINRLISFKTLKKNRYYITFLDAATKWLEIYLIFNKRKAFNKFKAFTNIEENNTFSKLKRFHSDNAKEYLTSEFNKFYIEKGILHTINISYSSKQNGSDERINKTLLNKIKALLIQSNLAKKYWGEAITASVYLYNKTSHSAINYKTPYELKHSKKPDLNNIKI
jgi:transposase InsO family protein